MKEKVSAFYQKYSHAIPLACYAAIYLSWFAFLERTVTKPEYLIHTNLDDVIPFVKVFVIPYYLWFGYVIIPVMYLFFKSREEYWRAFIFLSVGMTVFLIVSTVWPNGHDLRPAYLLGDDLCTNLIRSLYKTDTPTNLWPSIHVYNSLGVHFAIIRSDLLKDKKWIQNGSLILCISIIASTMLIKQHSVFDVVTAVLMSIVMYYLIYNRDVVTAYRANRKARKARVRY
ncbi:MAG: phosphatase PAP2 family protein [Lachnospiraceae bacterium]|nr:phosphatase PAP2 family protein [Lachnospiraceae bacterium]